MLPPGATRVGFKRRGTVSHYEQLQDSNAANRSKTASVGEDDSVLLSTHTDDCCESCGNERHEAGGELHVESSDKKLNLGGAMEVAGDFVVRE